MILVDTAVWIDHFHRSEPVLVRLLEQGAVASHPMVVGELVLGSLKNRQEVVASLMAQHTVQVISDDEYLQFVEDRRLMSRGLSYVDVHLLASTLITPGTHLWTRDRRLHAVAEEAGVSWHAD